LYQERLESRASDPGVQHPLSAYHGAGREGVAGYRSVLGFIAVARPEWMKFQARSMKAVYEEYQRVKDERYVRLHLDHVPVIDEDGLTVDYQAIIREAIQLGFQSVMVDGSRLPLAETSKPPGRSRPWP